jgi:hypothetical protein
MIEAVIKGIPKSFDQFNEFRKEIKQTSGADSNATTSQQ